MIVYVSVFIRSLCDAALVFHCVPVQTMQEKKKSAMSREALAEPLADLEENNYRNTVYLPASSFSPGPPSRPYLHPALTQCCLSNVCSQSWALTGSDFPTCYRSGSLCRSRRNLLCFSVKLWQWQLPKLVKSFSLVLSSHKSFPLPTGLLTDFVPLTLGIEVVKVL